MEFKPELFDVSIKITFGTIILMIITYLIEKKFNIRNIKWIMLLFWLIGIVIYTIVAFKIYIISIIQTII